MFEIKINYDSVNVYYGEILMKLEIGVSKELLEKYISLYENNSEIKIGKNIIFIRNDKSRCLVSKSSRFEYLPRFYWDKETEKKYIKNTFQEPIVFRAKYDSKLLYRMLYKRLRNIANCMKPVKELSDKEINAIIYEFLSKEQKIYKKHFNKFKNMIIEEILSHKNNELINKNLEFKKSNWNKLLSGINDGMRREFVYAMANNSRHGLYSRIDTAAWSLDMRIKEIHDIIKLDKFVYY